MRTNLLAPKTRRNAENLIGRWGAGLPLWFILAGCSPVAGVRSKPPEVRLLVNDRIGVVGQPEFPPRFLPVTRRGKRRDALVVIAPSTVKIALRGISGAVSLRGWIAPVFNVGDGIQLDVKLTDSEQPRTLHSRRFDPARSAADRDWIPMDVDLNLDRGAACDLEISVSAGPQGDLVGDWLALADWQVHGK